MISAKTYNVTETLRNGILVKVRAIKADSKDAIPESFKGLDDDTLYRRFFAPKKYLSEQRTETVDRG